MDLKNDKWEIEKDEDLTKVASSLWEMYKKAVDDAKKNIKQSKMSRHYAIFTRCR